MWYGTGSYTQSFSLTALWQANLRKFLRAARAQANFESNLRNTKILVRANLSTTLVRALAPYIDNQIIPNHECGNAQLDSLRFTATQQKANQSSVLSNQ
jgi:hypothetical protein